MPIKTTKLRDIPDEHLRAIGLVSLHWSAFETMIFRMIWLFSGMSVEDCRALVTHMSFPQRIDALVTMVGLVAPDSPEHKALAKFAENEIKKKLSAKRASIVHLDWWPDDLVPSHIKGKLYKARGSLKEESLRMSEADILAIAEEIRAQTSEFVGLVAEITPNQLLKLNLTGAALKDHGPKDS